MGDHRSSQIVFNQLISLLKHIKDSILDFIPNDSDQETDVLVDGAVKLLTENSDSEFSTPEKSRMNETKAKRPRLTLNDMFPSAGKKLPNFKKKADKLKAKSKAKKEGESKESKKAGAVKEWQKQPPRCKKFLVRFFFPF